MLSATIKDLPLRPLKPDPSHLKGTKCRPHTSMSFLSNARDKAIEFFFQRNDFAKKFGEIQNVDIDSQENQANITILLHGEYTPTTFCAHYCFEDTDEGTMIVINKIESERIMFNELAAWWFKDHTIKKMLPKGTGLFAKILF